MNSNFRYYYPKHKTMSTCEKKQIVNHRNTFDKNFGLDFNCKDAINFEMNFIVNIILILEVFDGQTDLF